MKNILFSTTRQWNPGDEFILMGSINLLKNVIGEFNPVIYNRNPEVRQNYQYLNPFRNSKLSRIHFKGIDLLESFFRFGFWDNSFKDEMELDFIDMVVFAGSPEWISGRLKPLYKKLLSYEKPVIYLGIGSGKTLNFKDIKSPYLDVLKKAKLITVRDFTTYELLKPFSPYHLPCPALFSSPYEKEIKEVKKIGLIFATNKAVINNRVSKETHQYILNLYTKMIETFKDSIEFEIVCHYIDELPDVYNNFQNIKVHYSYDSKDYIEIYKNFDLVIGPRVHGIGLSASLGIPGILIGHDVRSKTGEGFLSKIIMVNTEYEIVKETITEIMQNISQLSYNLINYKKNIKEQYINILKESIAC